MKSSVKATTSGPFRSL